MDNIGEVKYQSYEAQKCEIREQTEKSINSLFEKGVINLLQKEQLLQMYLNGDVSFGDDGLTEEEAQNFTSETFTQIQNAIKGLADKFRTKTMYIVQYGDTPQIIAQKMGLTGDEAKNLAQDIKATAQRQGLWYKYGLRVGDMIQINGDFQDKIEALRQSGEYLDETEDINNNYNESRRLGRRGGHRGEPAAPTPPEDSEQPETPERPETPPSRPKTPPVSRTPEVPRKPPMEPQRPQGPTEAQSAAAQKVYDESMQIVKTLGQKPSPNDPVLKRITPQNVAFVIKMYHDTYGKHLSRALIENGDKNGKVVYNMICHHLCTRAKQLGVNGIYYGDAQKCINNPGKIYDWLNVAYPKILEAEKKHNPAYVSNADYETSRKRVEYEDTTQLRKDSVKVARELHNAIYDTDDIVGNVRHNLDNSVTKGILKKITPSNAAFVVKTYKDTYKKDLARDIDDEIGLGIKEIKDYICSKLYTQAQKLRLYINRSYQSITKIDDLVAWIDSVSKAVITAMDGNASTLPSEKRETKITPTQNGYITTVTNGPMFVEADLVKKEEEYDRKGNPIRTREYFKDGKVVQEEQYVLVFKGKELVKSYPLYDANGNKRAVENGGKIVKKRTLLKHGSSYKPIPASDITEPVPMEIKLPKDANSHAREFAQALEKNKVRLMELLNIDNDTYNRLAKLAMAIAEQETNFGTNMRYGKYLLAGADTVLVAIGTTGAELHGGINQVHNLSFGPTQIKYDMHVQDADVKAYWETLGIKNGIQLYDLENSALATMSLLAVLNRRVKDGEMKSGIEAANGRVITNDGWEKKNGTLVKTYNTKAYVNEVDEEDAIAMMWNAGPLPVKYGSVDSIGYEYTRNVRQFKKKYRIKEEPADRERAIKESKAKKQSNNISFKPMDNNGPMGSIIFMPKMYSNKPVNKTEEIKILKNGLSKNSKIKQADKNELIRAVEQGELAFEFGLTAEEVASLTQSDVDKLLKNLRELKQKIESSSNVKFSDGISAEEAKILGNKFKKDIRRSEYNFKRAYLNSKSKRVKLSSDNKNAVKLNNNSMQFSAYSVRRGFVGNIPDRGVNTSGTSAASAALAKFAQKTSTRMTNAAKAKGHLPGGYCMTGFRKAIRAAGIDDSDLLEGKPRAAVGFFERHPDMFEEVKWIDLGNGNGRQINSTDLPKLPAGYIVIWVPDSKFSQKEGHISITNGNGQAYADETDNLDWGGFSGHDVSGKDASGKGEHGHFRVFRLTNKWTVGPDGKLVFNG